MTFAEEYIHDLRLDCDDVHGHEVSVDAVARLTLWSKDNYEVKVISATDRETGAPVPVSEAMHAMAEDIYTEDPSDWIPEEDW